MTMQPLKNEQAVALITGNQTSPLANTHITLQPHPATTRTAVDAKTNDILSGAVIAPASGTTGRLVALQVENSTRAIKVQATRAASFVEARMEAMKAELNGIVKNYPPFLKGSEIRQQYLMSIGGIREQIEAMTIPHNKFVHPALNDASSNQAKQIWGELFQGIGIPALSTSGPNEASDAEVQVTYSVVDAMQAGLAERRAALEQQVASPVPISTPAAQYISKVVSMGLAQTGQSLTTNLTGALKDF